MQFFYWQNLVFLAIPKTGTTSIQYGLRPFVSLDIMRPPQFKHMNVDQYERQMRPMIREMFGKDPESFAVMRAPVDRLSSWYRYRQGDLQVGGPNSSRDISFDDFVEAYLDDRNPARHVGRQDRFLMAGADQPKVDHIFQYGREDLLLGFLQPKFNKPISFRRMNVSPPGEVTLDPALQRRLIQERAMEFALWAEVIRTGHLHTPRSD